MRGDVHKPTLSPSEAHILLSASRPAPHSPLRSPHLLPPGTLQIFYLDDKKYELVQAFNNAPQTFSFDAVIRAVKEVYPSV